MKELYKNETNEKNSAVLQDLLLEEALLKFTGPVGELYTVKLSKVFMRIIRNLLNFNRSLE